MSVTTRADEHHDEVCEAIKNLDRALASFALALAGRCWGYDEFRHDFPQDVIKAMSKVQEIKELVG